MKNIINSARGVSKAIAYCKCNTYTIKPAQGKLLHLYLL